MSRVESKMSAHRGNHTQKTKGGESKTVRESRNGMQSNRAMEKCMHEQ